MISERELKMNKTLQMKKLKAVYLLNTASYDNIYGAEERADLSQLLEFIHPQLDAETVINAPAEVLREVEVIVSGWGMIRLDATTLDLFPRLKLVLYGAGSVKNFVTPEMWVRGILIVSAWSGTWWDVCMTAHARISTSLCAGRPELRPRANLHR